ncbi:hypothetical protein TNCV_3839141 [Trichonephila clavipes]|nr:hypothetical protein TNCV_3839141 [Trichonephila clavipes]
MGTVGSLVVRSSDSRPEGLGSMPDATKYPPSAHGTGHLIGTSDHAPQRPRSRILRWANQSLKCARERICRKERVPARRREGALFTPTGSGYDRELTSQLTTSSRSHPHTDSLEKCQCLCDSPASQDSYSEGERFGEIAGHDNSQTSLCQDTIGQDTTAACDLALSR